jgi:hypothetical protein
MIHRFDIFEMSKELQINLASNNSLMQFHLKAMRRHLRSKRK